MFLLGSCRPRDPLLFLVGFQPLRTLWGGPAAHVPPCIPRGSASRALRFFLVPRSWKPLTCGYVAAGASFLRKVAPIFLECHKYSVPCRVKIFDLGTNKNVFTGGLPPPRPPAVPGGLPAPQTPWRGACSPPCPPAYREAPPLGLSVFLWYQDLGTRILVPRSWYQGSRRVPRFMMGSVKK